MIKLSEHGIMGMRKKGLDMAKILVTMPDEFLNKVDGLADTERCSRSELIRQALRNYMRRVSKQQLQNASRNAEILEDILS